MTRDLRTLIYLLNLEECVGPWYAIGEQQSKRTQSGEQQFDQADAIGGAAASRSGRDRAAQQLKRAQSGSSSWTQGGGKQRGARAAVEADVAIEPGSSS